MSEEIWKVIEDFPNYEVSTMGRVRNIVKDLILKPCIDKSTGYTVVNLYTTDSKPKRFHIHRLVAEAFLPNSESKRTVNHIDCDKTNNNVSNLEWATDSENMKHAFANGLCEKTRDSARKQSKKYQISLRINDKENKFLYDFQQAAVEEMFSGCILNGGVGSGKSRTGLYYYFKEQGGSIKNGNYTPMVKPKDLYIITTAMKRDSLEWEGELVYYLMYPDPDINYYNNKIIIDSWNNIQKYKDVDNAFFIFDEDRVTGSGAWVKTFLKIAKKNEWIILSATPGDKWLDYIPVFIANGFYRNRTEFINEHVVYNPRVKFPMIDRYINTGRLVRLRNKILIDMDFQRKTNPIHEDVYVTYDTSKYRTATRKRWDPFKNEPISQASGLCYVLRRIVNSDEARQVALLELLEDHPRAIIFYNFDYELNILKGLHYGKNVKVAEWNGHNHQPIPDSPKWVYLVQYTAGCEGFNCITTDTIIFYSQNYSYKVMTQAAGRIDRLNSPFKDLYYYHFKSRSGIDLAISKALTEKKQFNEKKWVKW